jgi:hypothetical protein
MKPTYAQTYVGEEMEVENSTISFLATQYKDRFRKGSRQVMRTMFFYCPS